MSSTESKQSFAGNSEVAFEFQAFEAIFEAVLAAQNKEYLLISARIKSMLHSIKDVGLLSLETQSTLGSYKSAMLQLLVKVSMHRKALDDIMDEDDTMALMNLTKLLKNPSLYK